MGSTFDCSSNNYHNQLGDGVQKMVPSSQDFNLFWFVEGEKAKEDRLVQRKLIPRLHNII